MLQSSITPEGRFRVGIHNPGYRVRNLREHDHPCTLGTLNDGRGVGNAANFPAGDIEVERARGAGGEALRPGSPARPALDGAPHQELTTGSTAVEIAQVNAADAEIVDAELVHDNRQDGSN